MSRRFGKAARRNRIKRLLREFFRRHKHLLPCRDLVIMAKRGAEALDYWQVEEELAGLLPAKGPECAHD
jgi:ribonuclease P protein component